MLFVWRGVGCEEWTSEFVWMGGEGWNYGGPLVGQKRQNHLKVKQSRITRVYLGFIRPNSGTMRSGPVAGLVGCIFT